MYSTHSHVQAVCFPLWDAFVCVHIYDFFIHQLCAVKWWLFLCPPKITPPPLSLSVTHVGLCQIRVHVAAQPRFEICPPGCAFLIAWLLFNTHSFIQPITGERFVRPASHAQRHSTCCADSLGESTRMCARACSHVSVRQRVQMPLRIVSVDSE